jgi:hypothetical protein
MPAVVGHVLPALEQVQRECVSARTQEQVRAAADTHRTALRRWAQSGGASASAQTTPAAAAAGLFSCPDLGERGKGLVSLLYRLDQEAPNSITWDRDSRGSGSDTRTVVVRPAYMRAPACADSPAGAVLAWAGFLESAVGRRTPSLIALPLGERWVDLIIGEATGASLYCLRANEKGIPLTSDIPYTIDATFAEKAGQFLGSFAGPPLKSGVRDQKL